jgi:hypothetical protein
LFCWCNVIDCVPFIFFGDRREQFRRRRRSGLDMVFIYIVGIILMELKKSRDK